MGNQCPSFASEISSADTGDVFYESQLITLSMYNVFLAWDRTIKHDSITKALMSIGKSQRVYDTYIFNSETGNGSRAVLAGIFMEQNYLHLQRM